jgi:dihydrofolate reductase
MRKIIVSEFITLDGVMEAPGGEKSLGERSGWTLPYQSKEQGKFKYDELFSCDTLLLGRKTYEGFAAAWPTMKGTGEFGERMNSMPKYVVSTTLENLEWNNSTLIKDDVMQGVKKLKDQPGRDILVYGSAELVQALTEHNLVDEYRLMIFPVILGVGKHLFKEDGEKKILTLKDDKKFELGVVVLTYENTFKRPQ